MRGRTLILFVIALMLAGGTAVMVRSWLAQRPVVAAAAPPPPPPQKSILVARAPIARGQILKPADVVARPWPEAAISADYVLAGSGPEKSLAGSVAREPFVAGEPIIAAKLVRPGEHGFLAAVLRPGMRAVSVPVDATSDVSGFVFAGDRVDILVTLSLPAAGASDNGNQHKAAETVLRDVRVIAIDQRLDNKDGQAVVARDVTFEVTPKQSEIIAVATEMGKLSLSLRSLAASPHDARAVVASADPQSGATADPPADSVDDNGPASFTLDSEVTPELRTPRRIKHNLYDDRVCILRGNGGSSNGCESQPASRGS